MKTGNTMNRRWTKRHLATGAATLLTMAVVSVSGAWRLMWPDIESAPTVPAGLSQLVDASAGTRFTEGRLAGGFAYARLDPARSDVARSITPAVRIAAAQLEQRAAAEQTPAAFADHAAGLLVSGHTQKAIDLLSRLARQSSRDPRIFNDLAAAYLTAARAKSSGAGADAVRALDSATIATRHRPTLAEAWFNRALATELILPAASAARAWQDYLQIDGQSEWAAEARTRASRAQKGAAAATTFSEDVALTVSSLEAARALVQEHPQSVREHVLDVLLPHWGRATVSADRSMASRLLESGRLLAEVLATDTGDPQLREIIAGALDSAGSARNHVAEALVAYGEGRELYRSERTGEAAAAFARAQALVPNDHPLRAWTQTQIALVEFDARRLATAERQLEEVSAFALARGYLAVLARAHWLRGLTLHQSNRIDSAMAAYGSAVSLYQKLGERENELSVYTSIADNLRLRGERRRSWEYVSHVLTGSDAIHTPLRRYVAFYNATLFAMDEDLPHAALHFQEVAVEAARATPTAGPLAEALTTRARVHYRLGDAGRARADLDEAASAVTRAGDDEYLTAWLRGVRGEIAADRQPAEALPDLSHAAAYFRQTEPASYARLLLWRGRAHLATGNVTAAERDFEDGIADFERRRLAIRDVALRVSYLDEAWDLFTDMVDLQLRQRRADTAFTYAERGRARALLDAAGTAASARGVWSAADVRGEGVLLVFKQMRDRLLCWVVEPGGIELVEVSVTPETLERDVRAFRESIQTRAGSQQVRTSAKALYERLISPVSNHMRPGASVVVVPDGALHDLPFAALVNPRDGRFLVESHSVVVAPSATMYAGRNIAPRPSYSTADVVVVSDLKPDRAAYPDLAELPASIEEAESIRTLYNRVTELRGPQATRTRFIEASMRADVIHFSGHAVVNAEYPWMSALLLSADRANPDTGALFAHEIRELTLPRTRLVVLAACETGTGTVARTEGALSLARPFLMAGVPDVVATIWKVEDQASRELFTRFHRHLRASNSAAAALREAQLELLRSGDEYLRHPFSWAGVGVIGTAGPN